MCSESRCSTDVNRSWQQRAILVYGNFLLGLDFVSFVEGVDEMNAHLVQSYSMTAVSFLYQMPPSCGKESLLLHIWILYCFVSVSCVKDVH